MPQDKDNSDKDDKLKKHGKTVIIPLDKIDGAEWNPNTMSGAKFDRLVAQIAEEGVLENIVVITKEDDRFLIISGHKRAAAARVAGYKDIPCRIKKGWDYGKTVIQNMRFNILKGKIDPLKFTKAFNSLSKEYQPGVLKDMMGFEDETEFERLYIQLREDLPPELQKKLDESKSEIKTVEDLSNIINKIFSEYGDTLERSYMVFSYGGREHLYIVMDKKLRKKMEFIKEKSSAEGRNINEVMLEDMS